jgi:hypothetical protein
MTRAPTITGTPQVGSILTAVKGSWEGNPAGYAVAWSRPPLASTGADGTATTMSQLSGFPAAHRQQLLVMFLRATKPGDPSRAASPPDCSFRSPSYSADSTRSPEAMGPPK